MSEAKTRVTMHGCRELGEISRPRWFFTAEAAEDFGDLQEYEYDVVSI